MWLNSEIETWNKEIRMIVLLCVCLCAWDNWLYVYQHFGQQIRSTKRGFLNLHDFAFDPAFMIKFNFNPIILVECIISEYSIRLNISIELIECPEIWTSFNKIKTKQIQTINRRYCYLPLLNIVDQWLLDRIVYRMLYRLVN